MKPDPEDDRFCVTTFTNSLDTFPSRELAIPADATEATVRLRKKAAPTSVHMQRWNRVGRRMQPKGTPSEVPFVLSPHTVDGTVRAWDVTFALPEANRLYLQLEASWPDDEGCVPQPDTGSQHATWRFNARRG